MQTPSKPQVDLEHLARYTGGDRALDLEVLRLFVGQSSALIADMPAALAEADGKRWHYISHSLKGAARGIGAFALADLAAAAESLDLDCEPSKAKDMHGQLQESLEAVHAFIRAFEAETA